MRGTVKGIVYAVLTAAREGLPAPTSIEPFAETFDDAEQSHTPDARKIIVATAWLSGGYADRWSRLYQQTHQAKIEDGRITWPMFLEDLDKKFRLPDEVRNARHELEIMCPRQGESIVSFFERVTRVRRIAQPEFDGKLVGHLTRVLPNRLGIRVVMEFYSANDVVYKRAERLLRQGRIDQTQSDAMIAEAKNKVLSYDRFREMAEQIAAVEVERENRRAEKKAVRHREEVGRAAKERAAGQREAEECTARWRAAAEDLATIGRAARERNAAQRDTDDDFKWYHHYNMLKRLKLPEASTSQPDSVSDRSGKLRRGECFKCGTQGHIRRNCPRV